MRSCTARAEHACGPFPSYLIGESYGDRNNVIQTELVRGLGLEMTFANVLNRLPITERIKSDWPFLIPTFAWGRAGVFENALGGPVTTWDPTNIAVPMQFSPVELGEDGRLLDAIPARERMTRWILSSLQDHTKWVEKRNCKWPVLVVGNKRMAKDGKGQEYLPERELLDLYTQSTGHLAFGYPLAAGGWWRMRYVHAAMCGTVSVTDYDNSAVMPPSFAKTVSSVEVMNASELDGLAERQHAALKQAAWPRERVLETLDKFVKDLKESN